jgi:putative ABC transport system permease protein
MKFLSLVWSNLKRKKLRTSLTLLSIFVGFVLYGLLCTLKESFTGGIALAGADRLVVRHKVSLIMTLPASYKARMERIPGVASAVHLTWFNGIYQDEPKNFFGSFPTEPEEFLAMYPEFLLPPDQKTAWLKTRTGAIAGRALIDRFHWKIGDRIALKSPIWPGEGDEAWEFEIVGIYEGAKKGTDTSGFYFRYDYFDEARQARGKGMVGWYGVKVADPDRAAEVAAAIDKEFANSPHETKAEPEGAFMQGFAQQIGDIATILIAILSAVFFTILLVAGNTMAQAVRERTEEIGVLKAMGYTNRLVLFLVLAESIFVAAVGGFAGLGVAWLITAGGSPMPSVLPIFYLPVRDLMIGVGLVYALGFLTGIIPAWQAMRLQVAVALRRNG